MVLSRRTPNHSQSLDKRENYLVLLKENNSETCYHNPTQLYINNSLHLALKYARIFVRGHYLFREANSFPRGKLEENCELRGTDNVQGQISEHIFAAKLRLMCLLSIDFKNWGISSVIKFSTSDNAFRVL